MQPFKIFFITTGLMLFFFLGFAQVPVKNYTREWKKIDELITKRNLPASALTEVKKIYALAKKEKQQAQVVKSVVYMIRLQRDVREDHIQQSIKEIEKEISASNEPVTSIFRSLLAEVFWSYYQQNRWKFFNRTETVSFKKDDPDTWTVSDFHRKISELFLESIKQERLLQQTRLQPYDAIIIKGNMRHLRPTLFDLLAHRALDYFENDERDIAKPAYAFEINTSSAFDPAAAFIRNNFSTRDSLSLKHKALRLYQRLLAFHLVDAKPDALIDADIARLVFVYRHSTHPDKKELYRKALRTIGEKYSDLPAASLPWYHLAQEFKIDADSYNPHGDTTHRYANVRAKEILERIIKQRDSSEGKILAINLLKQITDESFSFSVEKVNIPGQPFRVHVKYRNTGKLHIRVLKATEELKTLLQESLYEDRSWRTLNNVKPIRSWQQALPATNDHQQHSVEIKVDAFPAGEYILLASSDEFKNNSILGARLFYVSNISYLNKGYDHFVLHRETGKPLNDATVQVWEQVYDYQNRTYTTEKGKQYKTDRNGFFKMLPIVRNEKNRSRENYKLDITWNQERFYMNDWIYDQYYYMGREGAQPISNYGIFFFTDRSIYRPGQTVYFKGIAIANDKEIRNKILENLETVVYLRNANGELVDSVSVTTNEFGSFNGRFQLPQGLLNGEFSIYSKNDKGSVNFSVEEYKRPKFFVEYEKIKGSYKVTDSIRITGNAKAYAGNNIDGAVVKYRVVREPRFLYPWLFRGGWWPRTAPMEIAHGETTTNAEGKFFISFEAIPDRSIDRKFDPVFDYRVYADITDINGETRSGETRISAGYKSLLIKTELPASMPVDSLKTISISTTNMSGEFEKATLKVVIYKLKEEKRLTRPRYWQQPNQFVMSKEEFIQNFPYDEYKNESDPKTWEKESKVYERSDSSRVKGEWSMGNGQWAMGNRVPGWYVIEITTLDKDGNEVKDVKYVELYDEKTNQFTRPQYLWSQGSRAIEPGETTSIRLGTTADDLFLVRQTTRSVWMRSEVKENYDFFNLDKEKKRFDFTATEQDRGGYGVQYFFVKHNRFFNFTDVIKVPWTNKELTIEYATFRDKTLPGSEEQWKIRISGYKKEKVAAEMLASMYDASLDQFRPHQWSTPSIWPVFSNYQQWNSASNFSDVESQQKIRREDEWKTLNKTYDNLIPLWYFFNGGEIYIKTSIPTAAPVLNEVALQGKAAGVRVRREEEVDADGYLDLADTVESELSEQIANEPFQPRKNFNETAFFFPDLRTDADGSIEFSFTIPEALTRWKFQAISHTKDLAMGYSSKEIITQKQLMVQPNPPRFFREGDRMEFSAKIVNMTDKEMTGQAQLLLFDATTNQPVDGWFRNTFPNQYFTVAAGQSEAVNFPIEVPFQFNRALVWRVVARSGEFSDGEEAAMPVLTNRMLVTESLPVNMRTTGTKSFRFEKLLSSGNSETLLHHGLTIEYTSNPAWYAVQALPYLMEYPYDCAEQVWNRYYANALATHIANSAPRIKQIFESWKTKDTAALLSNLQKNQELKAVLLEETPWVLQAKNEEQQKKNIALLFDLVRMSSELNSSLEKLRQMQGPNGGFVWFKGGPDDRYITQYIITGIGHLMKLTKMNPDNPQTIKLNAIIKSGLAYLDARIKEDYDRLVKSKANLKIQQPGYHEIQYLYMRSFFSNTPVPKATQTAYNYYKGQAKQFWMKQSKYMQGMIALSLHRGNDKSLPAAILKSLKETSISNEELGRYWKDQTTAGWFWFQAPIEMQALMIEAFNEIGNDRAMVDDLRTWLLKNKQTSNWRTTKATAEAVYALLMTGSEWLQSEPVVEIRLGNVAVNNSSSAEAGTGYFKKVIEGSFVKPEMGNIQVSVTPTGNLQNNQTSWGSVYWQYFEDLDKITTASTPLKLDKKLFIQTNTDRGPVLAPLNEGATLKVGDKIKVRIELRVDRDMEYVHMKDMRASALEPVNVLSGYKWQGGLGYYETTKDASTNFFFNYLRKGTYVFEYQLFVTNKGNFSNGITTIQSMYAPEFMSHSEGIRFAVE